MGNDHRTWFARVDDPLSALVSIPGFAVSPPGDRHTSRGATKRTSDCPRDLDDHLVSGCRCSRGHDPEASYTWHIPGIQFRCHVGQRSGRWNIMPMTWYTSGASGSNAYIETYPKRTRLGSHGAGAPATKDENSPRHGRTPRQRWDSGGMQAGIGTELFSG